MRPLDSVLRKPEAKPDLAPVRRKRRPPPETPADGPKPRRFKVVDVMTGEIKAQDASARATVDLLKDVRRIGDVRVYVWSREADRWRLLTLGEQRKLWQLRDR